MTENITRMPPQVVEAEMAVIGGLLIEKSAANVVFSQVKSDEVFYKDAHRKIYAAARSLFDSGIETDIVTISAELEKRNQLEAAGGHYYLTELVERIPSAANVEYYIKIVLDKWKLRRIIEAGQELMELGYTGTEDPDLIIQESEEKIFQLSSSDSQKFVVLNNSLHSAMERLEICFHEGKVMGIETGFREMDTMLSGLQLKELYILAGRPSMGKTALAGNMARNIAANGEGVAIFSLETTHDSLSLRFLCQESCVDLGRARTGKVSEKDIGILANNAGRLSDLPIYIQDAGELTVSDIRSQSRWLKAQHPEIGVIIIDYLQLMHSKRRFERRDLELADMTRKLKALAKELDVVVICLSQLSRANEIRQDEPRLSDLRDSGAIEQDAYCVLFIHRPEMMSDENIRVRGDDVSPKGWAQIIVAKNKDGATGFVWMRFVKEYTKFIDPGEWDRYQTPTNQKDMF